MSRRIWVTALIVEIFVSVLVLNGFGGELKFVDTPGSPISLPAAWYGAIGDFNEDGHLDIAVLVGTTIRVLLGNGDGTFQQPTDAFPVGKGAWNCTTIASGDFNNDGHLDLLIANPGTGHEDVGSVGVFMLEGDGKENFHQAGFSPAGFHPTKMAVADFDRDGNLDIAVACSNYLFGHRISLLFGDGGGGFERHDVMFPIGTPVDDIVVADFNGDGWMDLATANDGWQSVFVLLAHPSQGRKGLFPHYDTYKLKNPANSLTAGDFDGDGDTDLAIFVDDHLVILNNEGNGKFSQGITIDTPNMYDSQKSATVDLNKDGKLDLVSVDDTGGQVGVYLGAGDGSFHRPLQPLFKAQWSEFKAVLTGLEEYPMSFPESIQNLFTDYGLRLSIDAWIRSIQEDKWQIIDRTKVYLLQREGDVLGVYSSCSPVISPAPDRTGRFWEATWLGIGDFNEDGNPDLAVIGDSTAGFFGVSIKLSRREN